MTGTTTRRRYTLTPRVDLAVYYAADAVHYASTGKREVLDIVTVEAFAACFAHCPSRGFACDGQAIGGMIFDGEQAHIAVLPEHHGRWGFLLAPTLDWVFGLKPEMIIRVEPGNKKAIAFMERNQWERVGGEVGTFRMMRR